MKKLSIEKFCNKNIVPNFFTPCNVKTIDADQLATIEAKLANLQAPKMVQMAPSDNSSDQMPTDSQPVDAEPVNEEQKKQEEEKVKLWALQQT